MNNKRRSASVRHFPPASIAANLANLFSFSKSSKQTVADTAEDVIEIDFGEKDAIPDVETRLRTIESPKKDGLFTWEESLRKRKEILEEKWRLP